MFTLVVILLSPRIYVLGLTYPCLMLPPPHMSGQYRPMLASHPHRRQCMPPAQPLVLGSVCLSRCCTRCKSSGSTSAHSPRALGRCKRPRSLHSLRLLYSVRLHRCPHMPLLSQHLAHPVVTAVARSALDDHLRAARRQAAGLEGERRCLPDVPWT